MTPDSADAVTASYAPGKAATAEPLRVTERWASALRVRVAILVRMLCYWLLWFAAARALFLIWFRELLPSGAGALVARSFLFGARMDLSAAAYLVLLGALILILTVAAPPTVARRILAAKSAFVIAFVALDRKSVV